MSSTEPHLKPGRPTATSGQAEPEPYCFDTARVFTFDPALSGNAVQPPAQQRTFARFRQLPQELQDMIWEEALFGHCVVFAGFWSRVKVQAGGRATFSRHGFDPMPIALACKDAAMRWRALYPQHTVIVSPLRRIRLNMNWTVFVMPSEEELRFFLSLERPGGKFQPVHFAVRYWSIPFGDITLQDSGNVARPAGNPNFASDRDVVRAATGAAVGDPDPPIKTLVKIWYWASYQPVFVAQSLIDIIWKVRPLKRRLLLGDMFTQTKRHGWWRGRNPNEHRIDRNEWLRIVKHSEDIEDPEYPWRRYENL